MEHLWEALARAYEVLGFESATEGDGRHFFQPDPRT
jgi:hypothetical protein